MSGIVKIHFSKLYFMEFRLRERMFSLSKEEVKEILRNIKGCNNRSRYCLEIEGKYVSVKDALMEVLKRKKVNLTKLDFTTQDAVRIFRKLGFNIVVKGKKKKSLDDLIGAIKEGGNFNAVEDKYRFYQK